MRTYSEGSIVLVNDDARLMDKYVDDNSCDICITSPPYNVGEFKDLYNNNIDDSLSPSEYYELINDVSELLFKKIRSGGRYCLNINQIYEQPVLVEMIKDIGWIHRATIIWDKSNIPRRTAWGSWQSPSDPHVLPPFEFIIVFHKDTSRHDGDKAKIDITRDEFVEYTNCLWRFPTSKKNFNSLKATFPDELPYRLMKLYSYVGDVVIEPFLGSGTTLQVASRLDRKGVGFELSDVIYNETISMWDSQLDCFR